MKSKELEQLATAAYGPDWKTPLANEVDCTREMLWRYVTERTPIPDYLVQPIRSACLRNVKKKMAALQKTLDQLEQAS